MTDQIKIRPAGGTWVVRAGGAVLGESRAALELIEGENAPVIYFPRADIAMTFLDATDTRSSCPHKGEAHYFSIIAKSGEMKDAAWSYHDPKDAVAAIKDYIAFYPGKAAVEQI